MQWDVVDRTKDHHSFRTEMTSRQRKKARADGKHKLGKGEATVSLWEGGTVPRESNHGQGQNEAPWAE